MPRIKIELTNEQLKKLVRLSSIGRMSVDDVIGVMIDSTDVQASLELVHSVPEEQKNGSD